MEKEFLTKKKELFNTIFNVSDNGKRDSMYPFSLFSANLKRFMSHLDMSQYENAYKNVLFNQRLASLEQYYRTCLLNTHIINTGNINLDAIKNDTKPQIFATFHTGSYRLLNSYLYEKGFKSVLIVRGKVFEEQLESIFNEVKPTLKSKKESDIIILDANDRRSIFRMKQLISEGYKLTVYLDGNTGVNDEKGKFSKSHLKIPFFESEIYIRKGIGQLAYLLGADIIPVISYKDVNLINNIEFFPQINFKDYPNKEFIEESIKICYSHLEDNLHQRPWQWECWTYIHNWINRDNLSYSNKISKQNTLNTSKFKPFYLGKNEFLTDMDTYKILPLKKNSINALNEGNLSMFTNKEITELKEKAVLI